MYAYTQTGRETHTKAFLAYLNPRDFLCNTSNPETIRRIEQETGPLDIAKLKKAGIPELQIKKVGSEFHTVGHEGRHRMIALERAGYSKVPTVLYLFNYIDVDGPQQTNINPQRTDGAKGFRVISATAYPITYAGKSDLNIFK